MKNLGWILVLLIKTDDKIIFIFQPRYESFKFPEMFNTEEHRKEKDREEKQYEDMKNQYQEKLAENKKTRPGIPTWINY